VSTPRQIAVARLPATALRLCSPPSAGDDDAYGEPLHVQLDAGGGPLVDRAVAALHAISADPRLLSEGAAMLTTEPVTPLKCYALRLMVAAGADEAQARRIQAGRGRGWSTPQAEAWMPDS
jgi:hypothetical protein